jgi:hypothetical protein
LGLCPVAVLQQKWTYIARKQNLHLTTKQHVHLTIKEHVSQNFTVQYKYNEQNTSYKTQKNNETRKTKKKPLPGIEPGPSSL